MPPAAGNPEELLRQAKSGREASLGALLELYRSYLGLLAEEDFQGRFESTNRRHEGRGGVGMGVGADRLVAAAEQESAGERSRGKEG